MESGSSFARRRRRRPLPWWLEALLFAAILVAGIWIFVVFTRDPLPASTDLIASQEETGTTPSPYGNDTNLPDSFSYSDQDPAAHAQEPSDRLWGLTNSAAPDTLVLPDVIRPADGSTPAAITAPTATSFSSASPLRSTGPNYARLSEPQRNELDTAIERVLARFGTEGGAADINSTARQIAGDARIQKLAETYGLEPGDIELLARDYLRARAARTAQGTPNRGLSRTPDARRMIEPVPSR